MEAMQPDNNTAQLTSTSAIDVTGANFVAEVMEPSVTQLVIVDFWAPWCSPCKQLGPMLEKVIAETNGAAKLAKIDIDQNAQIAQQLRIQSVPTVFAFFNKQLVDGFMGALPESNIREWLQGLIKATGAKAPPTDKEQTEETLAKAQECLETDDIASAQMHFEAILDRHPDHAEAFSGLLRCLVVLGDPAQAQELLQKAPQTVKEHKLMASIQTAIELALQANNAPQATDIKSLLEKLATNENDHQTRFDLALAYYAENDVGSAIECLLEIVKRDRNWHDDGARAQLVKIFEALGHMHPQTIEGRKKLSAVLFA